MKIRQWLLALLRKQSVTDGRTHGQRENSIPPTNKVCGGYKNSVEPDQMTSSEASWSGSSVFKKDKSRLRVKKYSNIDTPVIKSYELQYIVDGSLLKW